MNERIAATADVAVIVGRWQILQRGHISLLRAALAAAPKVVIVIGSAWRARDPRNPFTWQERQQQFEAVLTPEQLARVSFLPVRDYFDDERWGQALVLSFAHSPLGWAGDLLLSSILEGAMQRSFGRDVVAIKLIRDAETVRFLIAGHDGANKASQWLSETGATPGNFVAAVTHELKTPLTAIRLYGEMLRDGMVASEAKRDEYHRHITAESERLTRLDRDTEVERLLTDLKTRRSLPEKVG